MKNMKPRVSQMTHLLEFPLWKTIKLSMNRISKNQRFKYEYGRKYGSSMKYGCPCRNHINLY